MITIDELLSELKKLTSQAEMLSNSMKTEQEQHQYDFSDISELAKIYPITGHPMASEDEYRRNLYLLILATVIVLDTDKYEESFKTFFRIAWGMNCDVFAEEILVKAQKLRSETLDEVRLIFCKDDRRFILILECMLIAAQYENGRQKAMSYIAQLAGLLDIRKADITIIAGAARLILTNELNSYNIPPQYYNQFYCYLPGRAVKNRYNGSDEQYIDRYNSSDDYYKYMEYSDGE